MADYDPIDLSPHYNAGVSLLPEHVPASQPQLGLVTMRGLPFSVGADPARCYVALAETEAVRVEVGASVRHLIIAHRQLRSPPTEISALGGHVADYRFHLRGGPTISVPIRQRFEIEMLPAEWGKLPYLAVPDRYDELYPLAGLYWQSGLRQRESFQVTARDFYLWVWENPHPDLELTAVEFECRDQPLLIGAVTAGHADEHPFVRTPAIPVIIAAAGEQRPLEVTVDRGVTSYVRRLPGGGGDAIAAWGMRQGADSYAEIAAIPSATIEVSADGEVLGRARWSEVQQGHVVPGAAVTFRAEDPGRNWVHVRVLDDATGRPVPCRVRFSSPSGVPFQPHGHHNYVNSNIGSWHVDVGGDVRLGDVTYAYIDGTCQGWLPRGEAVAEVARGFEYLPFRERVHIEPGQRELTLNLSRWTDMASQGWYSGDSHVHFLSTPGAHLEQQGEDLRVVNLLQSQWGSLFTNTEDFAGRVSATPDGDYLTYTGQENRQHILGHLVLWGLTEPVMPWCSDGADEAEIGGPLESTLADWADRCHAQGGTVVIPHLPRPNGEPAVLITTGRADAAEWLSLWPEEQEEVYYRALNCGYRLPLVGGTDKMDCWLPVGLYRTYAHLDGEFSYAAWCAAVRAGRTFLSGGPMLSLRVDGHEIGDTVNLSGPGTVQVEAEAESIFPLEALEIVVGGRVVATSAPVDGPTIALNRLAISEPIRVAGHTWIAARCRGAGDGHLDQFRRPIIAHTSPVYVGGPDEWRCRDDRGAEYLQKLIEGGLAYVRGARSHYPPGHVTHHHDHGDHQQFIEAPFHEALAALRARYPNLP
jgi:hypothetical protein